MKIDYLFFKFYLKKDTWKVLLRDEKGDYSFDYYDWCDPKKSINLKEILTGRILCGFKIRHGDMKWLARMIMTGNAEPSYLYANKDDNSWEFYNKFLALDLIDVIGREGEIRGIACANGVDVNYIEKDEMILDYNILKWAVNKYQFEINMKFSFIESDGFDLKTCLEKNTNNLTCMALFNNTSHKLTDDEIFSLDLLSDELQTWLLEHTPKQVLYFLTSFSYSAIKDIIENKPEMLEFEYFNNKIKIGLGGAHFMINGDQKKFSSDDIYQLVHDDGASFYPFIMIKHDCLSRRADKVIVEKYINERFAVKGRPDKKLEDRRLKIKINSIFGKSKAKGLLYDPVSTNRTCVLGQLILITYANQLYKAGCKIIQGNTDGIYVLVDKSKWDDYLKIQRDVSKITQITFDSDKVNFIYQSNINNYLCYYDDGSVDTLGSNLCGDWTGKNLRYNSKKTYPIVHKAVKEYLIDGRDIEDTIRSCKDINMFILTINNDSYDYAFFGTKSSKKLSVKDFSGMKIHRVYSNKLSKDYKILADVLDEELLFDSSIRHFRLLPIKGEKRQVIFFNKDKETLHIGANQSQRMELLLNDLSEYNIDDYDVDYEFLIEQTKKRLI